MFPSGVPPPRAPKSNNNRSMFFGQRTTGNKIVGNREPSQRRQKFNPEHFGTRTHRINKYARGGFSNRTHNTGGNSTSSITPLSSAEKNWLTQNVKRGGGKYVFDRVQNHPEWRQIADKIKACYQCGAIGHSRDSCKVKPVQQAGSLNHISGLQSVSSLFEPGVLDHLNSRT
jgi:hypothetical protein